MGRVVIRTKQHIALYSLIVGMLLAPSVYGQMGGMGDINAGGGDNKQLMKQLKYLRNQKQANQNNQDTGPQIQQDNQQRPNPRPPMNNQMGGNQQNANQQNANQQAGQANQGNQANANANAQQTNNSNGSGNNKQPTNQKSLHQQAFQSMLDNILPLNPKDVRRLHRMFNEVKRAADKPVGEPPRPTSSSLRVDLSPGAAPPVIRLAGGYVSTLVFLDQTGEPWPIKAYDIGNPRNFDVHWDKESNMLMIQAQGDYDSANMAVRLKGQNTPVMLTLTPDQKSVDYRVDLHIPGTGPNAQPVQGNALPSKPSDTLLHILDGVPPEKARRVHVSGGQAQAWLYRNKLYIRTDKTIVSPSWDSVMTSTDGTHAYELAPTPVVLVSHHGQMVRLRLEGIS